jgi:hypothetical protein
MKGKFGLKLREEIHAGRMLTHLTHRGVMEPSPLYESPFTDVNALGIAGIFDDAKTSKVISILQDVRRRAAAWHSVRLRTMRVDSTYRGVWFKTSKDLRPMGGGDHLHLGKAARHHHFVRPYLLRFAQEAAWREDNRRVSNGEQARRVANLAMSRKPSVDSCGCWQRHKAA